jgi:RimJ/RimL family protein N-acetyltransferase
MTAVVRVLGAVARDEHGIRTLRLYTHPDNIASQRVLENAGFRREGLLRSYLSYEGRRFDALLYSLLPSDLA